MVATKPSAHRQSALAISQGARKLKKVCNDTWRLAPKAPMFTRTPKQSIDKDGKKKKVVRTKRLIGGHAYKIVASGGAAYAAAVMKREADVFRETIKTESSRNPWLPGMGPGAVAIFEQFLCAYAQEATQNAVTIRQGLGASDKAGVHQPLFKRLNGKLMAAGFDMADANIFGAAMPTPRKILVSKAETRSAKKAGGKEGKDGEEPPSAE